MRADDAVEAELELQLARIRADLRRRLGPGRAVVSLKEAARRLGLSSRGLRQAVRSGQLLTVPVGGVQVVPAGEVRRAQASRRPSPRGSVAGPSGGDGIG